MKIVVLWSRFGPYHVARLRGAVGIAAAHGAEIYGIEIARHDALYEWDAVDRSNSFEHITLFDRGTHQDIHTRDIQARLIPTLEAIAPDAIAVNGWAVTEARAAIDWCDGGRRAAAIVMSETKADDAPRVWWKELVKRHMLKKCSAALVGGAVQADYLVGLGMPRDRIEFGYDVVDNDYFTQGAAAARADAVRLRASLGLPERYFFACVRFIKRKNIDNLLRAYAAYRRQSPSAPWGLVVAGSGEEKTTYDALVRDLSIDGVVWPGFIQYRRASALLRPCGRLRSSRLCRAMGPRRQRGAGVRPAGHRFAHGRRPLRARERGAERLQLRSVGARPTRQSSARDRATRSRSADRDACRGARNRGEMDAGTIWSRTDGDGPLAAEAAWPAPGNTSQDCVAPRGLGSNRQVSMNLASTDTGAFATAATARQLRILHVINSTRPEGGGPIEAIRQATAAMAARGHLTEIACLDVRGDTWLADVPARVHPLGPTRTGFRYSPQLVPWLRANRHNYDCAIVHGIWLFPTYGTWRALRGTRLPYFVYTHGSLDPAHRDVMPEKHAKKMLVWMSHERRVLRDARAVFFTCELERDLARNSFWPALGEVDNVIVPYCVASPPGDVARQTSAFRQRFPELSGKRLVLFLSRIDPKKGADLLIRAFADVKNGDPNAHLVMAGSGEPQYEAELKVDGQRLGSRRAHHLDRHAEGRPQVGRLPRGGRVRVDLASGELRHRRGRGARLRRSGPDDRQGQHLADYRENTLGSRRAR